MTLLKHINNQSLLLPYEQYHIQALHHNRKHQPSETNYVGSSPTIGIFLYVAQAAERVLAPAFGNKLCWFESHYRHISLCAYLKYNWLQMMVVMKTEMFTFY